MDRHPSDQRYRRSPACLPSFQTLSAIAIAEQNARRAQNFDPAMTATNKAHVVKIAMYIVLSPQNLSIVVVSINRAHAVTALRQFDVISTEIGGLT